MVEVFNSMTVVRHRDTVNCDIFNSTVTEPGVQVDITTTVTTVGFTEENTVVDMTCVRVCHMEQKRCGHVTIIVG